jgi:hypothetical protein
MILDLDYEKLSLIGQNNILRPLVESRMGLETIRNNKIVELDLNTEYKYNSLGYRSKEFGNSELLVSGCSNTVGIGVPIDGTWGNMLSNSMKKDYDNLSILGASIHLIVKNIFAYLKHFSHPKVITVVFPDINRIHLPNFNNILKKEIRSHIPYHYFTTSNDQKDIPKYSKKPHALYETFPNEAVAYLNLNSILQLEYFCKSANIELLYTSWDKNTIDIINNLKNSSSYTGFIGEVVLDYKSCHGEIKNKFPNHFDYAADANLPYYEGHFSIHKQAHYADFFYEHWKRIC